MRKYGFTPHCTRHRTFEARIVTVAMQKQMYGAGISVIVQAVVPNNDDAENISLRCRVITSLLLSYRLRLGLALGRHVP